MHAGAAPPKRSWRTCFSFRVDTEKPRTDVMIRAPGRTRWLEKVGEHERLRHKWKMRRATRREVSEYCSESTETQEKKSTVRTHDALYKRDEVRRKQD